MNSKKIETFKISKEMQEKIDQLKDTSRSFPKTFTPEQDAIILEYYHKKEKKELADLIGVCISTMRKRYKELKDERKRRKD